MKYNDFEEMLVIDLAWRKKEISDLYLLASQKESNKVLLKSFVLLLYAHWEGYIKNASKYYIRYVSEKKIPFERLTTNFRAIALKEQLKQCIDHESSLTLSNEIALMNRYTKLLTGRFICKGVQQEGDKSVIDTHSNLSSKVFVNICKISDLDYGRVIDVRKHHIDSKLVGSRNAIGHGDKFEEVALDGLELTIGAIERLKNIMLLIIDSFHEKLIEYAIMEYYLNEKLSDKEAYDIKYNYQLEVEFEELN